MIREFSHIVHENFQQLTLKAFLYDMPPWVSHTASTNQTVLFFKVMLCISYSVSKGDIGIAPTRHPVKNASPNYYYAAAGRYILVSWLKTTPLHKVSTQWSLPLLTAPIPLLQVAFGIISTFWTICAPGMVEKLATNILLGHIAFSNFYLRIRMRKTVLILKITLPIKYELNTCTNLIYSRSTLLYFFHLFFYYLSWRNRKSEMKAPGEHNIKKSTIN